MPQAASSGLMNSEDNAFMFDGKLMVLIGAAILNVIAQSMAKIGLTHTPLSFSLPMFQKAILNPLLWCAGAVQFLAMIVWFNLLSRCQLSVALPSLLAATFILTAFVDVLYFKQPFSWKIISGLTAIIVGIIVINK